MPTLVRFFIHLVVLGLLALGIMIALVIIVDPEQRDISSSVSVDQMLKDRSGVRAH